MSENKFKTSLFIVICSVIIFAGCGNLGLGGAVDVNPPEVYIESPSPKSVLKHDIIIDGTVKDDMAVQSVKVNLKGISSGESYTYDAVVDAKENTWQVPVYTEGVVVDDNYNITVTASDKSNKKTTAERVIEIDNTAPVIIVDRPNSSVASVIKDAYGTELSISGIVVDDHKIAKLDFTVYDEQGNALGTVSFENVPKNFNYSTGKDFYTSIYGDESTSGVKQYQYAISATDEAGNTSTEFYLRTELDRLENMAVKPTAENIYEAKKHNDTSGFLQALAEKTHAAAEHEGRFSISQSRTPGYTVSGIERITLTGTGILSEKLDDLVTTELTKDNQISMMISPNLDGNPVAVIGDDGTPYITVYAVQFDSVVVKNNEFVYMNGGCEITSEPKTDPNWHEMLLQPESIKMTGDSYSLTVKPTGNTNAFYAIRIIGTDTKGNPYSISDNPYVFKLVAKGVEPQLVLESPESQKMYVAKDGDLDISGYAKSHSEDDDSYVWVSLLINNKSVQFSDSSNAEAENATVSGEYRLKYSVASGNDGKIPLQLHLSAADLITLQNSENVLSTETSSNELIVKVYDSVGKSVQKTKTLFYDTEGPVLEISSPDFTYWQNKSQFKITGSSTDATGTSAVYYRWGEESDTLSDTEKSDISKGTWTGWTKLEGTTNWAFTYSSGKDTTWYKGRLFIAAVDVLGNIGVHDALLMVDSKPPVIGDTLYKGKPSETKLSHNGTIYVRKPTEAEITNETPAAYFVISGTVTDNYGIADVALKARKTDGETASEYLIRLKDGTDAAGEKTKLQYMLTKNEDDTKWEWSIQLPYETFTDGSWTLDYLLTDVSGQEAMQSTILIIDTKGPVISKVERITQAACTLGSGDSIEKWYRNPAIKYEITAGDTLSGILSMEYSVDGKENWVPVTFADGKYTCTVNFPVESDNQGPNTVDFRVTDMAGNSSETSDIPLFDTLPPVAVTVTEGTGSSGSVLSNKSAPVEFTVHAADDSGEDRTKMKRNTGIKSVRITKVGSTPLDISALEKENGTYTLTIPEDCIEAGPVVVEAADFVGNTTSSTVFQMSVDTGKPSVAIAGPAAGDINMIERLYGTASDDRELRSVTVSWKKSTDGTWTTATYTGEAMYSWDYYLDVSDGTKYPDGTEIDVKVTAVDTAGNENVVTRTYTVNSASDIPVVTITTDMEGFAGMGVLTDGTMSTAWLKNINRITGQVEDDDGISAFTVRIYTLNDDGTVISGPSEAQEGAFNYNAGNKSWYLDLSENGFFRIEFKVTDTGYVKDESGSYQNTGKTFTEPTVSNGNGSKNNALWVRKDDLAPSTIQKEFTPGSATSSSVWSENIGAVKFGGTESQFTYRVYAWDANGVTEANFLMDYHDGESVPAGAVKFTDTSKNKTYLKFPLTKDTTDTVTQSGNTYVAFKGEVRVNGLVSGFRSVIISVKDTAGLTSNTEASITIDNTPPELDVVSHNDGEQVSGTVILKGTCDDVSEIKYTITGSNVAPGDIDWSTVPTKLNASTLNSWRLYFDNDTDAKDSYSHAKFLKRYFPDLFPDDCKEISTTDENGNTVVTIVKKDAQDASTENLYKADKIFYIHFMCTDSVGNSSVFTHSLKVDPQGDRPVITLGSPTGSTETNRLNRGGAIVLVGSTVDDKAGTQITTHVEAWQVKKDESGKEKIGDTVSATGSSWSFTLNSDNTYEGNIDIILWSVDGDGNESEKIAVYITVNKGAPTFGSIEPFMVRQYENNTAGTGKVIAEMAYTDEMWLTGKWWLEGSVVDDGGITSILTGPTRETANTEMVEASSSVFKLEEINKGYKIRYLIGNDEDGKFGQNTYAFTAYDNNEPQYSGYSLFTINYDNKKPELETHEIAAEVVQENGLYTMRGTVSENRLTGNDAFQSGYAYTALYFVRRNGTVDESTKADLVYDLLIKKGAEGNKVQAVTYDRGLYWKDIAVKGTAVPTQLQMTAADVNVHAGGLLNINGAYYVIDSVEGTTISLNESVNIAAGGSPSVARVGIAMIVDNMGAERLGSGYDDNSGWPKMSADDGDGMLEEIQKVGTTWTWEAQVNSRNIPDGPIEIHYVTFDKAGNYAHGVVGDIAQGTSGYDVIDTQKARVANNAPKLVRVWYGNDDDGNGTVEGDELQSENIALSADGKTYDTRKLRTEYTITNTLTIKGDAAVIPEFVGGNGNLFYEYSVYKDGLSEATTMVNELIGIGTGADRSDEASAEEAVKRTLDIKMWDILNKGIGANADKADNGNPQKFTFTIWDSTEETVPGTDSNNAIINLNAVIDMRDGEAPKASINKFYWTDFDDNSVMKAKTKNNKLSDLQGHIELEKDLPTDVFNQNDGILDGDPKVSGKIIITGEVSDNKLVKEIWLNITGMDTVFGIGGLGISKDSDKGYKIAEYNRESGWGYEKDINTEDTFKQYGIQFVIGTQTFSTGRHVVPWTLYWDTAKIDGVAKADVTVTVTPVDFGTPTAKDDGTIKEASVTTGTVSGNYRMDVVPYITGVKTMLNKFKANNPSVYNRSALGQYPVLALVKNQADGFKGPTEDETVILSGFNFPERASSVSLSTEDLPSGEYEVTTSNIKSLNNSNNNMVEYNQQPNGDNNNLLNDDVFFQVWEINDRAAVGIGGSIKNPTMAINPDNGQIGFAFASEKYFSMPGKVAGQNDSYYYWTASNGSVTNSMFTYNQSGESFGTVMGSAISDTAVDNFMFYMDRLGPGAHSINGTTSGIGGYRLEQLGYTIPAYETENPENPDEKVIIPSSTKISATRIQTPTIVADGDKVYLAYYDSLKNQILFKSGVLPEELYSWQESSLSEDGWNSASFSKADKNSKEVEFKVTYNLSNKTYKSSFIPGKYIKIIANGTTEYYQIVSEEYTETAGWGGLSRSVSDVITLDRAVVTAGTPSLAIYDKVPTQFGIFKDQFTSNTVSNYDNSTVQVIADVTNSGNFVSMDVTSTGELAIVWYDQVGHKLMYSTAEPSIMSDVDGQPSGRIATSWSTAETLLANAGEYCKVKADANGGIHITCFDYGSGDIKYIYLPSYNDTASKVVATVDTSEVKPFNLGLDVVKETNGKIVPYITWYCAAIAQPRMAYLVNQNLYKGTEGALNGMENGEYTGNWEITVVPTTNDVQRDTVNVALWKDNGVLKESRKSQSSITHKEDAEKSVSYGKVYGNGTSNPVIGYVTNDGAKGYIETAQMRGFKQVE